MQVCNEKVLSAAYVSIERDFNVSAMEIVPSG